MFNLWQRMAVGKNRYKIKIQKGFYKAQRICSRTNKKQHPYAINISTLKLQFSCNDDLF